MRPPRDARARGEDGQDQDARDERRERGRDPVSRCIADEPAPTAAKKSAASADAVAEPARESGGGPV